MENTSISNLSEPRRTWLHWFLLSACCWSLAPAVWGCGSDSPVPENPVELDGDDIAELLVVRAQPETAVAMITHTETEIEMGDRFRGSTK